MRFSVIFFEKCPHPDGGVFSRKREEERVWLK
jgi:hypothetical protein